MCHECQFLIIYDPWCESPAMYMPDTKLSTSSYNLPEIISFKPQQEDSVITSWSPMRISEMKLLAHQAEHRRAKTDSQSRRCPNHPGPRPPLPEPKWASHAGNQVVEWRLGQEQGLPWHKMQQSVVCSYCRKGPDGTLGDSRSGEDSAGLELYLLLLRRCFCFHPLLPHNSRGNRGQGKSWVRRGTRDATPPASPS